MTILYEKFLNNKAHLTKEGFKKIIKAEIHKGRIKRFTELCLPYREPKPCIRTLPFFLPWSNLLDQKSSNFFKICTIYLRAVDCRREYRPFDSKKPRLTKLERSNIILPQDLKDILVGLILGDLSIQKRTPNSNPVCKFEQGIIHKDYLFHLYDLFKDFCPSSPSIKDRKPDPITGNVSTRVSFDTYSLPCFNEYYNIFYPNGKKVIPQNITNSCWLSFFLPGWRLFT